MSWDGTVTFGDLVIAAATLIGPFAAVQVQVWLEKRRAREDAVDGRRKQLFRTLMATRVAALAPDHVHAINAIPIEFYKVSAVIDAHKKLMEHLNTPQANMPAWLDRRLDLLTSLLYKMAVELGYDFDFDELKREVYAPQWQYTLENEHTIIRQGLAKILSGGALPMDVKSFPGDPEAQQALKAVLKGEKAIKTEVVTPAPPA